MHILFPGLPRHRRSEPSRQLLRDPAAALEMQSSHKEGLLTSGLEKSQISSQESRVKASAILTLNCGIKYSACVKLVLPIKRQNKSFLV